MLSIAVAILGLGLLIVLHEGGHFLVARLCGMRVERFSIGFGPTLFGFKRGGTLFQVAPVPLGGFVQITGMNPSDEFDRADPFVYPNRPRWMRLATIVAGPAANYVTAFVIMLAVFAGFGMMVSTKTVRVDEAIAGRPAALAGMQAGDILVEANGRPVSNDAPVSDVIRASKGAPVEVEVLRDGKRLAFTIRPEEVSKGEFQIGVKLVPVGKRERISFPRAVVAAGIYPVQMSVGILYGIWQMVSGKVSADVTGPVGITKQIAKAAKRGAVDFLEIIAILSVYLGLVNLLPLPALDGGRALFLGVESVTRKRVNPRFEAAVHMVGFVLLFGVLLIVTYKDIFGHG